MKKIVTGIAAAILSLSAQAAEISIPQSALISSDYYYTDLIGGGIGNTIVTTGGGNAANIGNLSGRNDDGFMRLNLGFNISFFGQNYSTLYINNNGNVSFGNGISAYIPQGMTGATSPVISAYFSDVDTRASGSGVVHYRTDIANQLIVTWDQVGYFNTHADALNSFQMVLRGTDYSIPVGEGFVGFFYKDMSWEDTNTSTTAAVGFGDGAGNAEALVGSNTNNLNLVVNDHHIWFDPNLAPVVVDVPEPCSLALLGLGLFAVGAVRRKKQA